MTDTSVAVENPVEVEAVSTEDVAPVEQSSGLINKVDVAEVTETAETETETTVEDSAEDGELILGKFKTQDDLVNSYKELTKKLREKTPEAPEEYSLDFTEDESFADLAELDVPLDLQGNPIIEHMTETFKKHNLTQEALNDIVKDYLKLEAEHTHTDARIVKDLGDNAKETLDDISLWASKNFSDDQVQRLNNLIRTADDVKLVHDIVKMNKGVSTPDRLEASKQSSSELYAQAKQLKSTAGFSFSPEAKAQYEKLMDKAIDLETKGL